MKNYLTVVKKPIFVSSNNYLYKYKRKFGTKRVGFSGTLDPFASGTLIVASSQYTKLFQYFRKTPKRYRATIWLGVQSKSLDIENIYQQEDVDRLDINKVYEAIQSIKGQNTYTPPKYCAKKIGGFRAYELVRSGDKFDLPSITTEVFDIKLISYNHPFITFEADVSEGSYIRSLAQIILSRLEVVGTLSSLFRLSEGDFVYDDEKLLNPIKYLDISQNIYSGDKEWVYLGKPIDIRFLSIKDDGIYYIDFEDFFTIIEIKQSKVKYKLNQIMK
jgi:tRNA pseudouridine55 synthase